jgi:diguanylate cyclase (GGDEF)-like protein
MKQPIQNQELTKEAASQMLVEVESEIERITKLLQKLKGRVSNDDLTGLLRREEFFHRLNRMMGNAQGADVAVIMIDIDNFKSINDSEGHVVGDHVLQRVGQVLRRCMKVGAEVARFGGEEFIVAFGGTAAAAKHLAEAIRKQIQREVNVTVSVGVATAQSASWEIRRMVGMADEALYQAKHTGKNRVCLAA